MVTAADHANTIREALYMGPVGIGLPRREKFEAGVAALDALLAQAESRGAAGWARAMARAAALEKRAEAAEANARGLKVELGAEHSALLMAIEQRETAEAERDRLREQIAAVVAAVDAIAATRNPDDCFAAIKNLEATVRFIR